jgi:hypothetical protein
MALIEASELAALRGIGETALTQTVVIQNQTISEGAEGDDVSGWTTVATVKGWVYEQTPAGTVLESVGGIQSVPELFRLFVPVGTDAHSGYRCSVDGSPWYTIEHTNDEDTYPMFLILSLRKPTE